MQSADPVLDEVEETFARIDKDGDRSFDIEEFAALMLQMDRYASPAGMHAIFRAIDSDRDGRVTFAEFRAWCR